MERRTDGLWWVQHWLRDVAAKKHMNDTPKLLRRAESMATLMDSASVLKIVSLTGEEAFVQE